MAKRLPAADLLRPLAVRLHGQHSQPFGPQFSDRHPVTRKQIGKLPIAGGFAAFAGVLQASSLANAQPAAGSGQVLIIIAGVIIGSTSLMGGRGSIVGTLLGSTLLGILSNAFILLRLNPEIQVVSLGVVIVLAALFDQWRIRRSES